MGLTVLIVDDHAGFRASTREARTYGPRLRSAPARGFLAKAELTGPALTRLLA